MLDELLAAAEEVNPAGQLSLEILLTKAQLELTSGNARAAEAILKRVEQDACAAGFLLLARRVWTLLPSTEGKRCGETPEQ